MIEQSVKNLVEYAFKTGLINSEDKIYTVNRILEILGIDEYSEPPNVTSDSLKFILDCILKFAVDKGLINDNITERDLFDTKIMGLLLPRPSEVIKEFWLQYNQSPQKATDYYYKFCVNSDYIRRYRIVNDIKWITSTEYGDLDITINLSKPEKDPKAIALERSAKQSGYPKCLLCKENEGYQGRPNYPARQNHRVIPLVLGNSLWMLQYSPYVYHNEHCIVFNSEHTSLKINRQTFIKLLDFVKLFPHYFVGSNADLPIVGGSILTHDHFQGGNYTFAMTNAPIDCELRFNGFEDIKAGILKWPMSVIRLIGGDADRLVELADKILIKWRKYTDNEAFIFAETDGAPHNTITPIARKANENYELDLVLRNNITTDEHPSGVFHPHAELHNIKKENIGLIEVMGLAVLPSRLRDEMRVLADRILSGTDLYADNITAKHADWAYKFIENYENITCENIEEIIKTEIGKVFKTVLEHAGVFKLTDKGRQCFLNFINFVNS